MALRFLGAPSLGIELIYYLVIVISSFLIYFKTKELYELTSHKGIKYFRNAFLFFGIASAIKFFLHVVRESGINPVFFRVIPLGIIEIAFFAMIYLSTLALIFLVYSLFWKSINKSVLSKEYLPHIISFVVALFSIFRAIPFIFLIFQAALLVSLISAIYLAYRKGKHKELYIIYLLVFGFLILEDVMEFLAFFSPILGFIISAISIILFLTILFKVLKELNSK